MRIRGLISSVVARNRIDILMASIIDPAAPTVDSRSRARRTVDKRPLEQALTVLSRIAARHRIGADAERVAHAYALAPYVIAGSTIAAAAAVAVLGDVPFAIVDRLKFEVALVFAIGVMFMLSIAYRRAQPAPERTAAWAAAYVAIGAVNGLVWCSLGVMLSLAPPSAHIAFLSLLMAGLAAGTARTFRPLHSLVVAFSLPVLFGAVAALQIENNREAMALVGVYALGFILSVSSSKRSRAIAVSPTPNCEKRMIAEEAELQRNNAMLKGELARSQRALADLQANETHFRALVETSGDMVFTIDAKGRLTYVNGSAVEAILGYRAEEVLGIALADFATHASAQVFDEEFFKLTEAGGAIHLEGQFLHRMGQAVFLSVNAIALCDSAGQFIGASGTAVDLSEIKTAEMLLRQSLAEQNAILDSATVGIAIAQKAKIARANAELERMFGYSAGSATGMTIDALCGVKGGETWLATVMSAVTGRGIFDSDVECRRRDGSRVWCRLAVRVFDQSDGADETIWILHDISDRKQKEQAIEHAALHDTLTGLPNRALLSDRLEQAIKQAARANAKFGVLFVDLDRFKMVNDSIGHDGGDRLLRTVAERLRRRIRNTDTVARQGGDEFIVMLPEVGTVADVQRVAENLLVEIAKPIQIFGNDYVVTASIGVSLYPDHGNDAQSLLKHADAAMYRAKELGKNNYCVFTEELHQRASEDIQIENLLRSAIEREELEVFYQPRVDLATGRVCSLEALARWRQSSLGWVEPTKFIPVAERSGLISQLGEWVLRRACMDLVYFTELGYGDLGLSVNLSHCQLSEPGLVASVSGVLHQFRLDPRRLELELTETAIARDVTQAVEIMKAFEAAGFSIAIDDFGTGYSSLSKLKCFPIRTLKIDRVFINGLPHEEDDAAIVLAIIAMAKRLRIRVVAEGVETVEQRQFLVRHECDEGQGYLFGRPMPRSEIVHDLAIAGRANSIVSIHSKRRDVA